MNHATEEQLVFYFYGEETARDSVEAHLAACSQCRAEYQSLLRVLSIVEGTPVPERCLDYGAAVWRGLEPRLPTSSLRWRAWLQPRKLALAASMILLLLAAFLAGRRMGPVDEVQPAATRTAESVRARVLLVAVGDHLERSQMVLAELVNAHPNLKMDISDEQKWAEDLLGANRLYRQTAARAGDENVAVVLEDLERVLAEIAHSPSNLSREEMAEIRERIERQGILFKVRLLGSRMRDSENQGNPEKF